jgi:cell division protein FtsI/penicillin-binding protein 2
LSPVTADHVRKWLVYLPIAAIGVGSIASQARLQLVERDSVTKKALKFGRYMKSDPEEASRGEIVDRNGSPLAQQDPLVRLVLDKGFKKVKSSDNKLVDSDESFSPNTDGFYLALSEATGIPAAELRNPPQKARPAGKAGKPSGSSTEWVVRLSSKQIDQVNAIKESWDITGLSVKPTGSRVYPLGEAASLAVGDIVNVEGPAILGVGERDRIKPKKARSKTPMLQMSGLEKTYRNKLTGLDGKRFSFPVAKAEPLRTNETRRRDVPKVDGQRITTTLDSEIQLAAFEAVKNTAVKFGAERAVAVVMEPTTGDVLAMASYPSFDPKPMADNDKKNTAKMNMAVSWRGEPGSMFKVLILAKALDSGVIGLNDSYNCHGSQKIGSRIVKCDESRAHGPVGIEMAIARSCNLDAARWASKIGFEELKSFLEETLLTGTTDITVPAEARSAPLLVENDLAHLTATLGFGQSAIYTPIGLATAFSMLANQGRLVKPRLVSRIGETEQPCDVGKDILKPETAATVLRCMKAVVENERGTGHRLRIAGYELGGKTGTAEKGNQGRKNGYVSNFIGMVPAENPRAVVLVMVDHPAPGKPYHGSEVAGPAFREIAEALIRRFQLPKKVVVPARERRVAGQVS